MDILIDILNIMDEHELTLTSLHSIRIDGVYNGFWRLECNLYIQIERVEY